MTRHMRSRVRRQNHEVAGKQNECRKDDETHGNTAKNFGLRLCGDAQLWAATHGGSCAGTASRALAAPAYLYLDTKQTAEECAADLVSRMTQEEKYQQLYNGTSPDATAIPRLGVAKYRRWSEALHGMARNGTATRFPTGLGIASS